MTQRESSSHRDRQTGRPSVSRLRHALCFISAAFGAAGCSDPLTPDRGGEVSLQLAVTPPSLAPAEPQAVFEQANRIWYRVTELRTGRIAEDTAAVLTPNPARTVTLEFSTDEERVRIELEVRLLEAPLFRGSTTISLGSNTSPNDTVAVLPVPADLEASVDTATILVGRRVGLTGAVLYATGDTITSQGLSWRSLSPNVVTVDSIGLAIGLSRGTGFVEAAAMGLADTVTVVVCSVGAGCPPPS